MARMHWTGPALMVAVALLGARWIDGTASASLSEPPPVSLPRVSVAPPSAVTTVSDSATLAACREEAGLPSLRDNRITGQTLAEMDAHSAIRLCRRAYETNDPAMARRDAAFLTGRGFEALGDRTGAADWYRRAVDAAPAQAPDAAYALARLSLGNAKEMVDWLAAARDSFRRYEVQVRLAGQIEPPERTAVAMIDLALRQTAGLANTNFVLVERSWLEQATDRLPPAGVRHLALSYLRTPDGEEARRIGVLLMHIAAKRGDQAAADHTTRLGHAI